MQYLFLIALFFVTNVWNINLSFKARLTWGCPVFIHAGLAADPDIGQK